MNKIEIGLKCPFPPEQLMFRKGPGGKELVYITARHVMDRLDKEVGQENWTTDYHEVMGRVVCNLSLYIAGRWITKSDGADDTSIEGAKGALSDALKRAGVQWGIARVYYYAGAMNGRTPVWWATPEGYYKIRAKQEKMEIEQFKRELGNV
jgi:hypothetical protein